VLPALTWTRLPFVEGPELPVPSLWGGRLGDLELESGGLSLAWFAAWWATWAVASSLWSSTRIFLWRIRRG